MKNFLEGGMNPGTLNKYGRGLPLWLEYRDSLGGYEPGQEFMPERDEAAVTRSLVDFIMLLLEVKWVTHPFTIGVCSRAPC